MKLPLQNIRHPRGSDSSRLKRSDGILILVHSGINFVLPITYLRIKSQFFVLNILCVGFKELAAL
ncbi:hypothetical protein ACS2TP_27275, partial [Bacillus cereus group sp. BC58]